MLNHQCHTIWCEQYVLDTTFITWKKFFIWICPNVFDKNAITLCTKTNSILFCQKHWCTFTQIYKSQHQLGHCTHHVFKDIALQCSENCTIIILLYSRNTKLSCKYGQIFLTKKLWYNFMCKELYHKQFVKNGSCWHRYMSSSINHCVLHIMCSIGIA